MQGGLLSWLTTSSYVVRLTQSSLCPSCALACHCHPSTALRVVQTSSGVAFCCRIACRKVEVEGTVWGLLT